VTTAANVANYRWQSHIANQRAEEWGPCDDTTEAREIAR
jgi:hypothetical protein